MALDGVTDLPDMLEPKENVGAAETASWGVCRLPGLSRARNRWEKGFRMVNLLILAMKKAPRQFAKVLDVVRFILPSLRIPDPPEAVRFPQLRLLLQLSVFGDSSALFGCPISVLTSL